MKIIHLFHFKNSISRKIPFFREEDRLKSDITEPDIMNIEVVTEFIVKIPDDFIFEDASENDLLSICRKAQKTIEHYFVVRLNDYDVI